MSGAGKLTISRTQSNQEDDCITIKLDQEGGETIFVKVDLAQFTLALTGWSEVPCEVRTRAKR